MQTHSTWEFEDTSAVTIANTEKERKGKMNERKKGIAWCGARTRDLGIKSPTLYQLS